jgi:hypothetical protein
VRWRSPDDRVQRLAELWLQLVTTATAVPLGSEQNKQTEDVVQESGRDRPVPETPRLQKSSVLVSDFLSRTAYSRAEARCIEPVLVYTRGEAWVDRGAATFEQKRTERELASLNSKAFAKGYRLVPITPAS